ILLIVLALVAGATVSILRTKLKTKTIQLEYAQTNMKAYERDVEVYKDRYGQEHAKSIMFNQTLNEFKNSTDSINRRMHDLLKQQDKKLKNLETALYHVTEVDTTLTKIINIATMPDTTLDLSNEHITNIIKLSPTLVSSKVSLEDELIGSFDYNRETVKPPHTFFLFR